MKAGKSRVTLALPHPKGLLRAHKNADAHVTVIKLVPGFDDVIFIPLYVIVFSGAPLRRNTLIFPSFSSPSPSFRKHQNHTEMEKIAWKWTASAGYN